MRTNPIRVMVADDSPLCVDVLRSVIESDDRMEVVAVAHDGLRAVELAEELRPALVTIDVHMPKLDGLSAVERIMRVRPTRILVVTSDARAATEMRRLHAKRLGAADLVSKPVRTDVERKKFCDRLWRLVELAPTAPSTAIEAIGIVASTGGPAALARLLGALPADLQAGVLVVQHLTSGFAPRLTEWLSRNARLDVRLARDGDAVSPGRVLIAPDRAHLTVDRRRRVQLVDGPAVEGHRPSGTLLLRSIAQAWGARAAGVVLTGMGHDGVDGLAAIRRAGGRTIAQDEQSSVVWGMPRSAATRNAAERVLPLDAIAPYLRHLIGPELG